VDYSISLSKDRTYIFIKIRGDINPGSAMQINLEAHALGRQMNIGQYLVDVTEAINTGSATDNYEFAYSDMRTREGIDKHARVATLVSPGDHSHDFVETTAVNAGLDVRLFTDLEQAIRFLRTDRSTPGTNADDRGPR